MKVNKKLFNKLSLQAEAAKNFGMEKLAHSVTEALLSYGSYSPDDIKEYSHDQMQQDIHSDLWKVATRLLNYYNIESLDIEKFDRIIQIASEQFIEEVEKDLSKDNLLNSKSEPKLPGQE